MRKRKGKEKIEMCQTCCICDSNLNFYQDVNKGLIWNVAYCSKCNMVIHKVAQYE